MSTVLLVGILACAVSLCAPAFKSDRRFKVIGLLALALWAPYYWLLGAMTGFVFTLLLALRQLGSIFAHRFGPRTLRWMLAVLVVAMTVSAAVTWEGWHSLLPWAASVNGVHAHFSHSGLRLRTQLFFGDCAWLAYAVTVHAWPHAAFMVVLICINLATIRRLYLSAEAADAAPASKPLPTQV